MGHEIALSLVGLGTAIVVLAVVGALAIGPDLLKCLHYLTPITSLGVPLICAGLCVENGWGMTAGQIIVIGVLLFVTGPVLGSATGKLIAEQEQRIRSESPE